MSDRRQILEDKDFWLVLEFQLSAWLRECGDRSLRDLWCDGFSPTYANDTKHGIDVNGLAWIAKGGREQHEFSFAVSIPQRMLLRRRHNVALVDVAIDVDRKKLKFSVESASDPAVSTSRETNA